MLLEKAACQPSSVWEVSFSEIFLDCGLVPLYKLKDVGNVEVDTFLPTQLRNI
jgi:hypothetical protein